MSILLQSSKGGGLAGMFGGGGGAGVFGGRGAASFLSKVTLWLGVGFALTSVSIALLSSGSQGKASPADMLPGVPSTPPTTNESAPEPAE